MNTPFYNVASLNPYAQRWRVVVKVLQIFPNPFGHSDVLKLILVDEKVFLLRLRLLIIFLYDINILRI